MTTQSVKEYIRYVKKLQAAVCLYNESGNIDDFRLWMETEQIVNYLSAHLTELSEIDEFEELLKVCTN